MKSMAERRANLKRLHDEVRDHRPLSVRDGAVAEKTRQNIVHESEVQRQHARLRVPITVVIDNTGYRTHDWSAGGFSLSRQKPMPSMEKRIEVWVCFSFRGFSVNLQMSAEQRHQTQLSDGTTRYGFEFVDVDVDQAAALKFIIGAHLSGEIVRTADFFAVVGRDNTSKARTKAPPPRTAGVKRHTLVRIAQALLATLIFSGTAIVLGSALLDRFFVSQSASAEVFIESMTVRAPQSGALALVAIDPGATVTEGQPLLGVRRADNKLVYFNSPCDCVALDVHVREGLFVNAGEAVLDIADQAAKPLVRALFAPEEAASLTQSSRVDVRLHGEKESVTGKVVSRRVDRATGMVEVIVDVADAVASDRAGNPAIVTFYSFSSDS